MKMTADQIASVCGGRILAGDGANAVSRIVLDSREAGEGDLFVPGVRVEAPRFPAKVAEAGASAVFTAEHRAEDIEPGQRTAWIQVEDTRAALQRLGSWCRKQRSLPVVGITGSVGKTTTREMIAAALAVRFQVYKTPGNKNSQVGVPITMWEIAPEDEIAVIELGMSEPGELTRIARIAAPTMAVITNIGIAHIEQLGSRENILREKLTIQDGLQPGGVLILNGDDDLLRDVRAREGFRTVWYGTGDNSQYRAEDISMDGGRASFTAVCGERRVKAHLNVLGRHNVLNITGAIAAANTLGVPMADLIPQVRQLESVPHRLQLIRGGSALIIDDAYNANPSGAKAALETLGQFDGGKILVTPGMVELGAKQEELNRAFGRQAAAVCDYAVLVGEKQAAPIKAGLLDAGYPEKRIFVEHDLQAALKTVENIRAGDKQKVVLLENDLPDNY